MSENIGKVQRDAFKFLSDQQFADQDVHTEVKRRKAANLHSGEAKTGECLMFLFKIITERNDRFFRYLLSAEYTMNRLASASEMSNPGV